jgi:hypothetical protein
MGHHTTKSERKRATLLANSAKYTRSETGIEFVEEVE